jgi:hypothetical protein
VAVAVAVVAALAVALVVTATVAPAAAVAVIALPRCTVAVADGGAAGGNDGTGVGATAAAAAGAVLPADVDAAPSLLLLLRRVGGGSASPSPSTPSPSRGGLPPDASPPPPSARSRCSFSRRSLSCFSKNAARAASICVHPAPQHAWRGRLHVVRQRGCTQHTPRPWTLGLCCPDSPRLHHHQTDSRNWTRLTQPIGRLPDDATTSVSNTCRHPVNHRQCECACAQRSPHHARHSLQGRHKRAADATAAT